MGSTNQSDVAELVLPPAVVTRADVARLIRELEDVDNELGAQKARAEAEGKQGQEAYHMPSVSLALHEFAELNKIDLADDHVRMQLTKQLKRLKDKAPVIHMTFAVEADLASLRQLAEYIRKEFHPQALLQAGLQPSLVGGVYMRTPNRAFDFSIRAKLAESRSVIAEDLNQLLHAIPVVEAPDFVEAPPEEQPS